MSTSMDTAIPNPAPSPIPSNSYSTSMATSASPARKRSIGDVDMDDAVMDYNTNTTTDVEMTMDGATDAKSYPDDKGSLEDNKENQDTRAKTCGSVDEKSSGGSLSASVPDADLTPSASHPITGPAGMSTAATASPAAKKRKLSPASKEAKQQEKEAKERQKLGEKAKKEEEKARKEEEKAKKEEEKRKREAEKEEEKRAKEEEKKKREAEKEEERKKKEEKRKAKEEEKAAKEEEKRKKDEEKSKKERVSLAPSPAELEDQCLMHNRHK